MERICKKCGLSKPLETEFRKDRRMCRECEAVASAEYRKEHPDKIKIALAKWRIKNPELIKKWWKEHLDRKKESCHKRRARKSGNGGEFTSDEWQALKLRYNNMCLCCKRFEPEIKLTIDHVIPLLLGGNNFISNIQPLCGKCNSSKGVKTTDYRLSFEQNCEATIKYPSNVEVINEDDKQTSNTTVARCP